MGPVTLLAISHTLAEGHSLKEWFNPVYLLTESSLKHAVLPAILVIVFIETGLLFPLLPGDSLLFTGGMLAAHTPAPVPVWVLVPAVAVTAVAGDQCAYWIGRSIGPALFNKPDSRLFKQKYVAEAHAFFEKYGSKTIILGRFVPVVRTFMPVLAGVSKMDYKTFLTFDIIGGVAWGGGVTVLGYFLGNISVIANHIESIFLLIVFISILPALISAVQKLRRHEPVLEVPEQEPVASVNEYYTH